MKIDVDGNLIEEDVLVLGAGNFGTCLADHLALKHDRKVVIWAREKTIVDSINSRNENENYLTNVKLHPKVHAINFISPESIQSSSALIFAIPTQFMRSVLFSMKDYISENQLLVCVNKGIEKNTLMLPSQILEEVLGKGVARKAVFLSGPSFASEVVNRQITCVSVASSDPSRALRSQSLFHAPYFRVYSTLDVVGVEISGALKNVIALASGACSGLGMQMNSRAALITRGLAEITRIGVALGANPLTFSGLAGVGDLFLTCTSEKSRNFTVGYRIGRGEKLEDVLDTLGSVAEGVETTKAAYHLGRKLGVDTPQIDAVYRVLFEGVDIKTALRGLVERDPSEELRGII